MRLSETCLHNLVQRRIKLLFIDLTATPKSRFEFVPEDTEEFKFNQHLNLNLYREVKRNFGFSISTS